MGSLLSAVVGLVSLFSPPLLLFFAWKRFFQSKDGESQPRWRSVLAWLALLSVSGLLAVCIWATATIPSCNVDLGDWSCVVRWRSFTRSVLRTAPILIFLAFLGRKGTQILAALSVLAISYDCLVIDMMA